MTRTLTAFLLALIVALVARAEPPAAQPNTPVPPAPPAPPATATTADAKATPPGPAPYVRATDVDGGKHVLLQTAARTFRSADPGTPEIHLVGAVHIGEKKFYQELQTFLDQHDVVLFEGVKPPGAGAHDPALSPEATDDQRAELSKKRIHLTAMLIEVYKRDNNGQLPATLADLTTMSDKRVAYLATVVGKDAWGRPLVYTPDAGTGTYSLSSLAADGAAGGEGPNADIAYADLPQVTPEELPGGAKGIQSQLAEAFGLVFQLDEMDHTKPNWQNSDMSIDQVQARIEAAGADGSALFSMLDGSSLQARLAGLLFRLIAASPTFQTMGKVMLIDTLDKAEEMMAVMPGGMGKLMSVIIVDRNQVVIDDLKALLASRPDLKSIAIIYGAGHLADLEQRLGAMGYKPVEDKWFTAIDVDVTAGGAMTVGQVNSFRTMMARTMTRAIEESKRDGERVQLRAQRRQQREEQKQAEPAAEPK
jgi:hypothetical protein